MKYLYCVLGVILSAVLQSTIFADFAIFGIRPLFLLAFSVCIAILCGAVTGGFVSLACGLLMDMISGGMIGLGGLLLMYTGIFAGLICRRYLTKSYIVAAGVVFAANLVYEIVFYLLRFSIWGSGGFFYMLARVIAPECLYTAVMAVPVMFVIRLVMRQLQCGDEVSL